MSHGHVGQLDRSYEKVFFQNLRFSTKNYDKPKCVNSFPVPRTLWTSCGQAWTKAGQESSPSFCDHLHSRIFLPDLRFGILTIRFSVTVPFAQ